MVSLVVASAMAEAVGAPLPVLKRSDVVFMYQASRPTWQEYGATVLAWGGRPTEKSLREAQGLKFFGSVGMVTEFSRYYERFPTNYEQGLCRDVEGRPYRVPWLTDHQHQGVPFWWCCTRQPQFRQYLAERVADTVRAGAHGVHIDDHLGTAGGLSQGGCFCDRCVAEFRDYLAALPAAEQARLGVRDPAALDFRQTVRDWLAGQAGRKVQQHPLYAHFRLYQFRGAAAFMAELRALAERTAGRPVPLGANACLLWGPHLSDYQSLDLFSAEIPHRAETRRFSDDPLVAYRMADAVRRPLAATASGHDWAFIKEHNLPGLVQGWIALGYAAGHSLMAPNRQWCYTPEKGTHWYDGPKARFAPLYRFVRDHAPLFDGCENHADLVLALSQRTFDRDPNRVFALAGKLAAAHRSFRIALGSSELVDHPLPPEDLAGPGPVLVVEPRDFSAADQQTLATVPAERRLASLDDALTRMPPAVRIEAPGPVRVLPRVGPGLAVIHLVNWAYDSVADTVTPLAPVRLRLDLAALGVGAATEARLHAPGVESVVVPLEQGRVGVPELKQYTLIEVRAP